MNEKTGRPAKAPRVNLKDLKKLIDMMRKAELGEVAIEQEGLKINLKRDAEPRVVLPQLAAPLLAHPQALAPQAPPALAATTGPAAATPASPDGDTVTSPMVGTLYRSPSPDAAAFVKEGGRVEVGQTVCIIEAMKLMNEIKAESAGTLVKFLVESAQAVEYGQPLYILKP